MRNLRRYRNIFLGTMTGIVGVSCLNLAADASTIGANCTVDKTSIIASDDGATTTSTTFVLMPNMTRIVTTTVAGCVIVDFSGELSCDANSRPDLVVVAAGLSQGAPGSVTAGFPSAAGDYELRSMRWVFPKVPAGSHQFRLQWHNEGSGAKCYVGARTFTVSYK